MIRTVAETGSTNSDLLRRLGEGEGIPEGEWLVTDRQTAGRGRLGRDWLDAPGNFMGSTVVHRTPHDPPAPTIALVSALAVHEAASGFVPAARRLMLKWPNDVLIDGAKLAGILLEAAGNAVVVGIGVNLGRAPDVADRPAIALASLAAAPDRNAFAAVLAEQFANELRRWRDYGLAPVIARWQALAHPLGTDLLVEQSGEGRIRGRFGGLAEDGALRLCLDDGSVRVIQGGEVTLCSADGGTGRNQGRAGLHAAGD